MTTLPGAVADAGGGDAEQLAEGVAWHAEIVSRQGSNPPLNELQNYASAHHVRRCAKVVPPVSWSSAFSLLETA